jgi:hypothetical protein
MFVDQEYLLLGTNATHTTFNEIVVEQVIKRAEIVKHVLS